MRCGSVSRAADALGITQLSVSKALNLHSLGPYAWVMAPRTVLRGAPSPRIDQPHYLHDHDKNRIGALAERFICSV